MSLLTIAATAIILIMVTGAVCAIGHRFLTWRELSLNPPPGELIDVDGTKLHLLSMGTGSVTVVMEAGLGGTYLEWSKVQPDVAEHTRVCTYDRAGLGYSAWGSGAIDTVAVARRLHRLLELAGISGPFLLVGHSYGGIHVRTFARLYPTEVAGVVLVDSAHENQMLRLPAEAVRSPWMVEALFHAGPLLSRIGLYRLINVPGQFAGHLNLPERTQAQVRMLMQPTKAWRALRAEYRMSQIETHQERPPQLPAGIPLTVITQGKGAGSDFPHLDPASAAEVSRVWLELQNQLAALNENRTALVAAGASHYVQLDQPQVVIKSILELLTARADVYQGLPAATDARTPPLANSPGCAECL